MTGRTRFLSPVVLVAIAAAVMVLYFIFDPALSRFAPKCSFYLITGWECPGCGSQRMLHALLRGEIGEAWGYNPVLLCLLPVIGVMLLAALFRPRMPRFYAAINSLPVILSVTAVMIGWGIIRNLI